MAEEPRSGAVSRRARSARSHPGSSAFARSGATRWCARTSTESPPPHRTSSSLGRRRGAPAPRPPRAGPHSSACPQGRVRLRQPIGVGVSPTPECMDFARSQWCPSSPSSCRPAGRAAQKTSPGTRGRRAPRRATARGRYGASSNRVERSATSWRAKVIRRSSGQTLWGRLGRLSRTTSHLPRHLRDRPACLRPQHRVGERTAAGSWVRRPFRRGRAVPA